MTTTDMAGSRTTAASASRTPGNAGPSEEAAQTEGAVVHAHLRACKHTALVQRPAKLLDTFREVPRRQIPPSHAAAQPRTLPAIRRQNVAMEQQEARGFLGGGGRPLVVAVPLAGVVPTAHQYLGHDRNRVLTGQAQVEVDVVGRAEPRMTGWVEATGAFECGAAHERGARVVDRERRPEA